MDIIYYIFICIQISEWPCRHHIWTSAGAHSICFHEIFDTQIVLNVPASGLWFRLVCCVKLLTFMTRRMKSNDNAATAYLHRNRCSYCLRLAAHRQTMFVMECLSRAHWAHHTHSPLEWNVSNREWLTANIEHWVLTQCIQWIHRRIFSHPDRAHDIHYSSRRSAGETKSHQK